MTSKYTPKPTKGHPGWFEVPGFSSCCANRKGEILIKATGHSTKGGDAGRYLKVNVKKDDAKERSLYHVHELVCRAFHGKPKAGQVVLHKDDDRSNNRPSNLRWGSQSENIQSVYDNGLRKRVSKEGLMSNPPRRVDFPNPKALDDAYWIVGARQYKVPELMKLAVDVPVTQLPASALAHTRFYGLRPESVVNPDITKPLLVYERDGSYWLIDGYHRLARQLEDAVEVLSVKILTDDLLEPVSLVDEW